MRALGFDIKKADVLKIMKDYDREASGKISFDDFNEVSKSHNVHDPCALYLSMPATPMRGKLS